MTTKIKSGGRQFSINNTNPNSQINKTAKIDAGNNNININKNDSSGQDSIRLNEVVDKTVNIKRPNSTSARVTKLQLLARSALGISLTIETIQKIIEDGSLQDNKLVWNKIKNHNIKKEFYQGVVKGWVKQNENITISEYNEAYNRKEVAGRLNEHDIASLLMIEKILEEEGGSIEAQRTRYDNLHTDFMEDKARTERKKRGLLKYRKREFENPGSEPKNVKRQSPERQEISKHSNKHSNVSHQNDLPNSSVSEVSETAVSESSFNDYETVKYQLKIQATQWCNQALSKIDRIHDAKYRQFNAICNNNNNIARAKNNPEYTSEIESTGKHILDLVNDVYLDHYSWLCRIHSVYLDSIDQKNSYDEDSLVKNLNEMVNHFDSMCIKDQYILKDETCRHSGSSLPPQRNSKAPGPEMSQSFEMLKAEEDSMQTEIEHSVSGSYYTENESVTSRNTFVPIPEILNGNDENIEESIEDTEEQVAHLNPYKVLEKQIIRNSFNNSLAPLNESNEIELRKSVIDEHRKNNNEPSKRDKKYSESSISNLSEILVDEDMMKFVENQTK